MTTRTRKKNGARPARGIKVIDGTPAPAEANSADRRTESAAPLITSATPARKRHVGPGGKRVAAPKPAPAPKRTSCLDAAAKVLSTAQEPMSAADLVTAMAERGLWTSPGGKTPAATLYSAMVREVAHKAGASRFRKVDRGRFAAGKGA